MSIHEALLACHQRLGYTETEGICHGFSLNWLEACLLGKEKQFNDRIQWIEAYLLGKEKKQQDALQCLWSFNKSKQLNDRIKHTGVINEFVQSIESVKAKKGINLTQEDIVLLDILAFFDSVELFQNPNEHIAVFNTSSFLNQQDIEGISYFASSDLIRCAGGLAKVYSYPSICTVNEIKIYLDSLAAAIESNTTATSKETVGLNLMSSDHSIVLTYTQGKGWKFMDINQYPSKVYEIKQTNLLAKDIIAGFDTYGAYTAFTTRVFTTQNNPFKVSLKDTLDIFKRGQVVTSEMAFRKSNGVNLAYVAAQNGHASVIAELAKHGVDFHQATADGKTLAYIAAQNGHASVIAELAKHGVDFNKASAEGATPAFIAAQQGHASVIAELAKHGVDFNKTTAEGLTPACIAAHQGRASVIAELAKHGVDFNKATAEGVTPVFIAAQNGHASIIAKLMEAGANVDIPYQSSAESLRKFATTMGGKDIISRMDNFLQQQLPSNDGNVLMTPLDIAVVMGHSNVVHQLLKKHGNTNRFFGGELANVSSARITETNLDKKETDALKNGTVNLK